MSSLDKFERFEAWLKENGAQFDMVRARLVEGVRIMPFRGFFIYQDSPDTSILFI
jgi:hypothetical protein